MDQDLEPFFKDFGATVEQTVDLAAGVEETCYSVLQKTTAEIPWLDELNSKLQSCVERQFDTGRKLAHSLSQAKVFSDFTRLQTEFWASELIALNEQSTIVGKAYTKAVADAVNPASNCAA
jgi:hypothetical protein